MCWQLWPWAHESESRKGQTFYKIKYKKIKCFVASVIGATMVLYVCLLDLTCACFLVSVQSVSRLTLADIRVATADTLVLALVSLDTCIQAWEWEEKLNSAAAYHQFCSQHSMDTYRYITVVAQIVQNNCFYLVIILTIESIRRTQWLNSLSEGLFICATCSP